ncbi:MAG TPA: flagellin [Blastocatellia bacterium]|nr:flagellin [Blastocatellia bacterium]
MSISILHNFTAEAARTLLGRTSQRLGQTIEHLSSGSRITHSGDDAAGLAVANLYRHDVAILAQGVRNAHDGLSTLQIIDGGLNTIAALLDRASTLAAQSASETFIGSRDTLQQEFAATLNEITRQAQNIGLVQNGSSNNVLTTIIGGGSDAFAATGGNNGITIDLSGAANRVDAASLGLSGLNIGSEFGTVKASGGISFKAAGAALTGSETLTFTYANTDGTLATLTRSFAADQTAGEILIQLQADLMLKSLGITAGVDANGNLQFTGSGFFRVSSNKTGAGQLGFSAFDQATSAASTIDLAPTAAAAADTQNLTFTYVLDGLSQSVTISVQTSTSAATAGQNLASAINNNSTLRKAGIHAFASSAGTISIASLLTRNFTLSKESAAGGSANDSFGAVTDKSVSGQSTGGATGARRALDVIRTAIETLGRVQGAVGAGQNRLQHAVDLAAAQIVSFQAADSRIRDADLTAEASNLSRLSVLEQAGVTALAQANQSARAVLSLLQ